jgi:hypothetical protein
MIIIIMIIAAIALTELIANFFESLGRLGIFGPSISILGLLLVSILFQILHDKFDNRITRTLALIFSMPIAIVLLLMKLFLPVILILLFIGIGISILVFPTFGLFKLLVYFDCYHLKPEFQTYIQYTFSFTMLLLFNDLVKRLILYVLVVNRHTERWMMEYKYFELFDFIFTVKNIRFILYTFYLLFFIFYSYKYLGNTDSIPSGDENAILYSFLTFLALDQLIPIMRKAQIKPSELLDRIKNSIKTSFKKND